MDWIFEHLRLVILIGGAIAYWINQRQKARRDEEEVDAKRRAIKPAPAPNAQVSEEAERVRRIQAEIRRKIQERAAGGAQKRPQPPPLPEESVAVAGAEEAASLAPMEAAKTEASRQGLDVDQALLQRQQELSAKMRELEEVRRLAGQKKAERFAEATTASLEERAAKGSLLAELRDPVSARRAIIMREVLGTPVGLR